MKKIGGDNGAPLLSMREGAVAPLLAHVSGAVLTWVTLLFNGERALLVQNREKLKGVNLFLHFSRENFEGLEQTRGYLSHNMRVTRFWYNTTTFMGIKSSRYIFNRSSGMLQSHHIHGDWSLWIHFEQKFRDDAIPPHSWGPKPLDTFWTEVQGWCNPTTFTGTKASRYILNRCSWMMQSHHTHKD